MRVFRDLGLVEQLGSGVPRIKVMVLILSCLSRFFDLPSGSGYKD